MRVVVVGATGNVGTSVVERLSGDAAVTEIVGVARRPTEWTVPKTTFREADVAKDDLVPLFRGADVVVHLAWLFQPTHQPLITWQANAIGSARVFAAAAAAQVRALVYASSIGAYSPPGEDDAPVDEAWPTHSTPTAPYGREKAYVERLLDIFERDQPDVRVVRLRPGFVFKRSAASEQRRLFAGPFLPGTLVRPGRVPVMPHPDGLRFQALHSSDMAEAYALAILGDARGPFNVAAEPVVDAKALADVLGARPIAVPRRAVRAAVSLAWRAHLAPADPKLLDLVLRLPVMSTERAKTQLGWSPRRSATDALGEMLEGMADGAGGPTGPLTGDSPAGRAHEVATGVGSRP